MNEKFYDLKKEKQNRILNGIMKTFATTDYAHASTEEIVRSAKISKGLLFHYFDNKNTAYAYAYGYGVRYLLLELDAVKNTESMSATELLIAYHRCVVQAMRTYPYLMLFLLQVSAEKNQEAVLATTAARGLLLERVEVLRCHLGAEMSTLEDMTIERTLRFLRASLKGLLEEYIVKQEIEQWLYHFALDYEEIIQRLVSI